MPSRTNSPVHENRFYSLLRMYLLEMRMPPQTFSSIIARLEDPAAEVNVGNVPFSAQFSSYS